MNPEDDPEARIRELERPFTDIAQSSELGVGPHSTGGYPHPPSYPPPQGWSGAPQFPAPQPPKHTGLWLILGVVVLGLLALVIGVVAYTSTSGVTDTKSTRVPGGGGSFDTTTSVPAADEMVPSPSVAPEAPVAPGDQISVSGVGGNRTLQCNENIVNISGVSNIVTIIGHCASVQVSGVSNVVTVESAATISASGFENRVVFRSGDPDIGNSGSGNTVERG